MNEVELDERLDAYLSSKDVGPGARKKLSGILKHYAKKKHPFTACVRDNTKRFGKDRAEKVCATLKDIIVGNTKWRGRERLSVEDGEVLALLQEMSDEDFNSIILGDNEHIGDEPPAESNYHLAVESNTSCGSCEHFDDGFCDVWDVFVRADYVCDKWAAMKELEEGGVGHYSDYVPEGVVALGEFFCASGDVMLAEEADEKGIWKTILRTGVWKMRPGSQGGSVARPLIIKEEGPVAEGQVALREVLDAFQKGAREHVTVPLSHDDKLEENTGFVRKLRIVKDGTKARLDALIDFTEAGIKEKAENGSIANTSAGILFNHIRKRDGKKFPIALAHVALTNTPWIDGMEPFGIAASEDESPDLTLSFEIEGETKNEDEVVIVEPSGLVVDNTGNVGTEIVWAKFSEDVVFADSGYQKDQKKRYPLDTEAHIKHAWMSINVPKNARQYAPDKLKQVKSRIRASMKKTGVKISAAEDLRSARMDRLHAAEYQIGQLLADEETHSKSEGGDGVSDTDTTALEDKPDAAVTELGLSVEEIKSRLDDHDRLVKKVHQHDVNDRLRKWEEDGVPPAVLEEAKSIMMADDGGPALLLSQDDKEEQLTATDIVDRMIAKVPRLDLSDAISDQDANGEKPPTDNNGELSLAEKVARTDAFLEGRPYVPAVNDS